MHDRLEVELYLLTTLSLAGVGRQNEYSSSAYIDLLKQVVEARWASIYKVFLKFDKNQLIRVYGAVCEKHAIQLS